MKRELAGAVFVALLFITLVITSNGESSSEPSNLSQTSERNLWIAVALAIISVGVSAIIGYKLSKDTIKEVGKHISTGNCDLTKNIGAMAASTEKEILAIAGAIETDGKETRSSIRANNEGFVTNLSIHHNKMEEYVTQCVTDHHEKLKKRFPTSTPPSSPAD